MDKFDKKISKLAKNDAERWLSAEMAYGEGAGTRRKLLGAEIDQNMNFPGYIEAFDAAYNALDKNVFAKKAIKERKALDRGLKTSKNIRAIKSGNVRGLSTGLYVVAIGAIVAHQTGYDKKIEAEAKKLYKKAKTEVKFRKARFQGRNVSRVY